jgi:Ca-activated chloride channel homolog
VKFGQPAFLALLLLLPGFFLLARRSRSGLERGRSWFASCLRVLLFSAAVFALADAQHVSKSYRTATMFLLDHSFSVPFEVKRDATTWINEQLSKVPKEDVAGVILFGREAMIELPPRQQPGQAALASVVGRTATDLGAAIRLALAVFPEGYQRRIVVVSDGNENLGHARAEAETARAHGATVDVFPLRYDYPNEAWIDGLHVPPDILPKEPFDLTVVVSSQREGPANLILYRNKELLSVRKVALTKGKNVFTTRQRVEEGGSFGYRAVIEMQGDAVSENNEAHAIASARGEARVGVIPGSAQDAEALIAALRSEGLPAVILPADDLARRTAELASYDALIFANVEASRVGRGVMQAVEAAVHDAGVGLLFVGGEQSFGPGGYRGSPMEELLPVTMEQPQRRVMPNGALALILHTCEFDAGNFWAKKIAIAALDTLNARDYFGVLIYGGNGEEWLFKPELVANKARLSGLISGAWPGDMPSFDATLEMAHAGLKGLPAASKHIIVISDADPSGPTAKLVDAIVGDRISVSTVAIQPHGQSDIDKMAAVAARANGRFYHVQNANALPQIFIKEAATVQRSMVIEGKFSPVITGAAEAMKGIPAFPPLHGYTLVTAKPLARVSLGMPVSKEGQPADAPATDVLLAEWQYGLGKTMVFTSDAKNRWAKDWIVWENYRKFWSQATRSILRATRRGPYAVQADIEGGKGRVVIDAVSEDGKLVHTLQFKGSATSPEGHKVELPFRQTAPGRYEAEFEAGETGVYTVNGSFEGAHGEKGVISQGVPLSYAAEYRDLQANLPLLDQIRERTGGRRLATTSNVYEPLSTAAGVAKPLWPLLLTLLLALLPVDIFVRRVAVDWKALAVKVFARKKRAVDPGAPGDIPEHLRALAARKLEVRAETDVEAVDLEALTSAAPAPKPGAPEVKPAEAKPPEEAKPEGGGYLDKLLEAKKKAKKE